MAPAAAIAALAVTAVGTGLSIAGSLQQADAEKDAASAEAQQIKRDRMRRIGAARAKFGAAGVRIEGTPLDVLGDLAAEAELDRQLALYGGRLRSGEARQQAVATGIKGAGSLLTMGSQFNQEGAFGNLFDPNRGAATKFAMSQPDVVARYGVLQ